MDLRPSFESVLNAFSLDATVQLPGGVPSVSTKAVWLPPATEEVPAGSGMQRAEPRNVLALPKADVPQVPRGTVVTVPPEEGGVAVAWEVDAMERDDFDHHRVVVVRA